MCAAKMHDDQVETDGELVKRLLDEQFPQWSGLSVDLVVPGGTDHDMYRLGEELVVRLPLQESAAQQGSMEAEWLPRLAPHLPLAIPVPLALGQPAPGFPFRWSVGEWLPGENATTGIVDLVQAAIDLARFVTALRRVDTTGAHPRPHYGRGAPLAVRDDHVRGAVAELGNRIDGQAALRSWQESLDTPVWDGDEVWVHGDLLPANLLVANGRLAAVIDFGCLNVGDPACDLQPAWNSFTGESRERFRLELEVDDRSWLRGRGWALFQAVTGLCYYWDTNPAMVDQTWHALEQVLTATS